MSSSGKKPTDDDEVEQLLRAAQDDMLLKLSVNSHTTRTSAAIDPDLDRRFQALKKPQKPAKPAGKLADTGGGKIAGKAAVAAAPEGDDLFNRFAALKGSIPSHSGKEDSSQLMIEEDSDEDEVEKVIKWAIDAARLDPSPLSDDDDDRNEDSAAAADDDNDHDDSSEDDDRVGSEKKSKRK